MAVWEGSQALNNGLSYVFWIVSFSNKRDRQVREMMTQSKLALSVEMTSGAGLEIELRRMITNIATKYMLAEKAVEELRSLVGSVDRLPSIYDILDGEYQAWVRGVVGRFQSRGQGIGHASIRMERLPDELKSLSELVYAIRRGKEHPCPVEAIMERFDGDELVRILQEEAASLEERGIVEAANLILGEFGMRADWHREHPPKKTARYWVFNRRIYPDIFGGYSYELANQIESLAKALKVAGADSGVTGLDAAAQLIADEFRNTKDAFPSRTVLAKGRLIEAVVFKEKIEFRMSHGLGDTLLAFLKLNTSEEMRELEA